MTSTVSPTKHIRKLAKSSMKENKVHINTKLPSVIFPEINFGSFLKSAIAASGIPQLATGPQKCVLQTTKNTL